jgi:drug/metabolite transporter (DMT)-like permease
VLGLAGFGLTGFNALLYAAAHSTSAINIVLLQSCVPALVVMGAMARGDKISGMQFVGVAVTLLGVMIVATHGDLSRLRDLSFNRGDLMMMTGCLGGAWYNLSLRKRPPIPAIVFFAGLSLGAAMTSAPLLMVEAARGQAFWPSWIGWSIIIFCALAPALGAQVFFLRAVDLIGAARAGVYTNLVPVFGAILGVIAGEVFAFYHAVGLVLVIGGIWLAERRAETPR